MTDIDHIDDKILQALEQDGRMSNLTLASRVGLSPSACLRRVRDLERAGVIKGYRAVLDRNALGVGFTSYITVALDNHTKAAQTAFERVMRAAPEVRECHNVTGTVEYLLRVEVADIQAYKAFHTDVLETLDQVRALVSYIVLSSPKDERA
jgi:Lrp/AsnC family leucine-responsive transcriptional regulator